MSPLFCYIKVYDDLEQLVRQLKQEIEPICHKLSILLFDIMIKRDKQQLIVKIIVDTETGVTLGECQRLSEAVSDLVYRRNLISQGYRLEVSSPGVDKPLQFLYEYRRNIGRNLLVIWEQQGIRKEIKGELATCDENGIRLKTDEQAVNIPFKDIKRATVKLKW
jgi:ribosome maturation factor RimP